MLVAAAVGAAMVFVLAAAAWRRHRRTRALAQLTPEERASLVAQSLARARLKQHLARTDARRRR